MVEVGGGLRSYTLNGRDLLDGYPVDAMADGGRGAVLAPWPNRIEGGRYAFAGRELQLALTEPRNGNAIHGLGRWASWVATKHDDSTLNSIDVTLVLRPQPGYPFHLRLSVHYLVDDAGLTVTTTASNEGAEPCPYGTGAHPYLTLGTELIDTLALTVPASTVWHADERGVPRERSSVEGTDFDFRRARPIGTQVLDHCLTDLARDTDGTVRVRLDDPESGAHLELWMDSSYRHVMVFSGDTLAENRRRRGIAIEPMTCPANAFRTGEDVITLEPGASVSSRWGLTEGGIT